MIRKYEMNPIVSPDNVKPSVESYRVRGAFNPGATVFGDEVLLLLRVAETCEPKDGYIRTPTYRFDDGHPRPRCASSSRSVMRGLGKTRCVQVN